MPALDAYRAQCGCRSPQASDGVSIFAKEGSPLRRKIHALSEPHLNLL